MCEYESTKKHFIFSNKKSLFLLLITNTKRLCTITTTCIYNQLHVRT